MAYHRERWYNIDMTDFGKGPTLAEANPWLRDEAERIERILDVTECAIALSRGFPHSQRGLASGSARNSLPVLGLGKRPANDLDHRGVVSLERSLCRLDVLTLPFVDLVVDQKRPSRLCGK